MSKEARLVARLKALLGSKVWPLIVPQGQTLPATVYELSTEQPVNDSTGTTKARKKEFLVVPMAAASESQSGYDAMVALADLVIGNETRGSESGLSGWTDADGDVWHLDSVSDTLGEMLMGEDVLRVYAREMIFSVWV